MTRLIDADDLEKKLHEIIVKKGFTFSHGNGDFSLVISSENLKDLITNAPTIEADSGEADAEVYSTAVYPNSNGMYEHTFLFNDRLAQQTELYLYNPNKYQKREWVELNYQEILACLPNGAKRVPQGWQEFYDAISTKLKEVNHG